MFCQLCAKWVGGITGKIMTESAQIDAILHGAAFAPVTDRAFLRITGADATRWLNGMVTNNIAALAPGEGCYNFLLNAQGRIQGDCTLYREPDGDKPAFLLVTQNSQLETIQKTLDHFIIMDDVELKVVDDYEFGIALLGPRAPEVLASVENPLLADGQTFADLPPLRVGYYSKTADQIMTPPPSLVPCFELNTSSPAEQELICAELTDEGAVAVSPQTLEAFRIYSGTPRFGTDIRNTETARDLPQETGQTHALHFAKGCYLGQEIVERIRSRGQVHRQFTRFKLTGELPATLPAPLEANGKAAGELTSAARICDSPHGDTIYALGYARREALDTHQPLSYPGGTAVPTKNPQPTTENQHG
jgi:folate-binding protein YgfZ